MNFLIKYQGRVNNTRCVIAGLCGNGERIREVPAVRTVYFVKRYLVNDAKCTCSMIASISLDDAQKVPIPGLASLSSSRCRLRGRRSGAPSEYQTTATQIATGEDGASWTGMDEGTTTHGTANGEVCCICLEGGHMKCARFAEDAREERTPRSRTSFCKGPWFSAKPTKRKHESEKQFIGED